MQLVVTEIFLTEILLKVIFKMLSFFVSVYDIIYYIYYIASNFLLQKFKPPSHCDGLIEVMGFNGVVHMGRIKSGMSSAIRIGQGSQVCV